MTLMRWFIRGAANPRDLQRPQEVFVQLFQSARLFHQVSWANFSMAQQSGPDSVRTRMRKKPGRKQSFATLPIGFAAEKITRHARHGLLLFESPQSGRFILCTTALKRRSLSMFFSSRSLLM